MMTVTIKKAQVHFLALLRRLPAEKAITITNRGKVVAFLISTEQMEALDETMELLANPEAMKAIQEFESGRTVGKDISSIC